ncbi:hypothetical protein BGZ90_008903, partial [Linnemannia elongata]
KYGNMRYEYMGKGFVIFITEDHNVGDMIELTKISRKSKDQKIAYDIFEIVGNKIKYVGYTIENIYGDF